MAVSEVMHSDCSYVDDSHAPGHSGSVMENGRSAPDDVEATGLMHLSRLWTLRWKRPTFAV